MRALAVVLVPLVALVGCAADFAKNPGLVDANPTGGDANSCSDLFISFDPPSVNAGPDVTVRATANGVPSGGVPTFAWSVEDQNAQPIAFTMAAPDNSAVEFPATMAGPIHVSVGVSVPNTPFCNQPDATLNVGTGNPNASYRLRVSAPPAPPQERTLTFPAATPAYVFGTFALDPGVAVAGEVHGPGNVKVPAYLRFIPQGRPDSVVEAFTDGNAAFTGVQLVGELHDVLVVPMIAGYAPWLAKSFDPTSTVVTIGTGMTATGSVKAPSGAALSGAHVQLVVDGIPSTIATTNGTGSFSLLYEPSTTVGAIVSLEVTPLAGSGLPRLTVDSTTLSPSAAIAVTYAPALAIRDLAGTTVQRGGAGMTAPKVTIAGTLAAAGKVNGTIDLAGDIHASAIASAAGVLPTLRAPNASLSAVVELSATDVAITAVDLTGVVPATIATVAPTTVHTTLQGVPGPLNGATLVAVPLDAMAQAGVQMLARTADQTGMVSVSLATGGHYDLRLSDPSGRGALTVVPNVTPATITATSMLPAAVTVTGKVTVAGGANPVAGAAIQVLCKACDGIDRTRPLAEAASSGAGGFVVGVPDLPHTP